LFRRLFQGMGAYLIGQVLGVAQRLLLVPLFLSAWGVQVYGDWLQLTSIASYFALLDIGGQVYIINRLTQTFAARDMEEFKRHLHTGVAIFVSLPLLVVFLLVALVSIVPPSSVLRLAAIDSHSAAFVIVFTSLQVTLTLPHGLILGVYRSVGLFPRSLMLSNLGLALQLALMGGALWVGASPVWLAILQIVPYLVVTAIVARSINQQFPEFFLLRMNSVHAATAKSFLRPSLGFFLIGFSSSLSIQGTILVVGSLFGPAALVVFATQRTVANIVRQALSTTTNASWPEFTRLDALGQRTEMVELFRWVLRTTLIASWSAFVTLHFFGAWIYQHWLGKTLTYDVRLMDLLLCYILQFTFWMSCGQVLMAVNWHGLMSRIVVTGAVFSILAAWAGGRAFGLWGVVGGIIGVDLVLPFWLMPYLLRRYEPRFSLSFYFWELIPIAFGCGLAITVPITAPILAIVFAVRWWNGTLRVRRHGMHVVKLSKQSTA
jgi:O-antigen/teichoic acid export membrane protein